MWENVPLLEIVSWISVEVGGEGGLTKIMNILIGFPYISN